MIIPSKFCGYQRDGRRLYPGGKGSSAPAPDPRLVEAQIQSLGVQDDMMKRIVAQSEQLQPLQEEQMRFGLQTARTAYDQSQDDRAYALERRGALTGLQDQLVSEARSFNTEAERERLAGQATGDVRQAFAATRAASGRNMARMGINPSSGAFAAMSGQMDAAEALGQAQAANTTRTQARAEGRALTDRAANVMAGYPAMGLQTTGAGAQLGAAGLGIANQGAQGMAAGYGTAAQIAGSKGTNASNMYGAQSKLYTDSMGTDNTGAAISAVGGIAAAFI